jgi:hypothetical protein
MSEPILLQIWPAEESADSLPERGMGYFRIVKLDLIKAADVEKRFQVRAAKPVFMR